MATLGRRTAMAPQPSALTRQIKDLAMGRGSGKAWPIGQALPRLPLKGALYKSDTRPKQGYCYLFLHIVIIYKMKCHMILIDLLSRC